MRQGAGGFPWRRLSVPRSVSMQVMGTATWPKGVKKKNFYVNWISKNKVAGLMCRGFECCNDLL